MTVKPLLCDLRLIWCCIIRDILSFTLRLPRPLSLLSGFLGRRLQFRNIFFTHNISFGAREVGAFRTRTDPEHTGRSRDRSLIAVIAASAALATEASDVERSIAELSFWDNAFGRGGTSTLRERATHAHLVALNASLKAKLSVLDSNLVWSSIHICPDFSMTAATGKRSGGQRRRLSLALLLALRDVGAPLCRFRSPVLLLDECDNGLDERGMESLYALLRHTTESTSTLKTSKILFITHSSVIDLLPRIV